MTSQPARNIETVMAYLDDHSPEFVADDAYLRDWSQPEPIEGVDAIADFLYDMYHVAFSDAAAKPRAISASADSVTLEFTFTGRNDGPFVGMSPTGRSVDVPMCVVYRLEDNRIRSIHVYYDSATMARQLGLLEAVGM
jgi:steroid delta-isomerase-like uncharacterized protein